MTLPTQQLSQQRFVLLSKILIHFCCLFLLIELYYRAISDQLGGDPVEEVLHFTGIGAFNLLLMSLSITPLVRWLKLGVLSRFRRLLGLYSFFYAFCHVLSFLAFELQFDWSLFVGEVIERPYISVGMLAAVILLSLAISSINQVKRRMGKRWQKLHNWVYLAVLLVALHFYWSVKSEIVEPSVYALISVFLLYVRKEKVMRWLKG